MESTNSFNLNDHLCPVELIPLKTAVQLNCPARHRINEAAARQILADKNAAGESTCPLCRHAITSYTPDMKYRELVARIEREAQLDEQQNSDATNDLNREDSLSVSPSTKPQLPIKNQKENTFLMKKIAPCISRQARKARCCRRVCKHKAWKGRCKKLNSCQAHCCQRQQRCCHRAIQQTHCRHPMQRCRNVRACCMS